MVNIEELSKDKEGLPLMLKLGAYRRNLMLSGLDKEDSELKDRGKQILYAMQIYKNEIEPEIFKDLDFKEYMMDPLGKNKKLNEEIIDKRRKEDFQKTSKYRSIKAKGKSLKIDVEEIEKKLKGEDDASMREILLKI